MVIRSNRRGLVVASSLNAFVLVAFIFVTFNAIGIFSELSILVPPVLQATLSVVALAATCALTTRSIPATWVRATVKVVALAATLLSVLGEILVALMSDGSIGPGLLPILGTALHALLAVALLIVAIAPLEARAKRPVGA